MKKISKFYIENKLVREEILELTEAEYLAILDLGMCKEELQQEEQSRTEKVSNFNNMLSRIFKCSLN